jgi:hypothetical protein
MLDHKSTIERAFELARDGNCHTIEDIRRQLHIERYEYVISHTSGFSIVRQLNALLKEAAKH